MKREHIPRKKVPSGDPRSDTLELLDRQVFPTLHIPQTDCPYTTDTLFFLSEIKPTFSFKQRNDHPAPHLIRPRVRVLDSRRGNGNTDSACFYGNRGDPATRRGRGYTPDRSQISR